MRFVAHRRQPPLALPLFRHPTFRSAPLTPLASPQSSGVSSALMIDPRRSQTSREISEEGFMKRIVEYLITAVKSL